MKTIQKIAQKFVFLTMVVCAGFIVTGCDTMGGAGGMSLEELTTAANNGDATAAYELGHRHLSLGKKADKAKKHEEAMKHYGEANAWFLKADERFKAQK